MTPEERKVFERALEALEREARGYAVHDELQIPRSMRDAITAIKEVLAQPEEPCDMKEMCIGCSPRNADGSCPVAQQEPVAWYLPNPDGYDSFFRDHRTIISCTGNPWTGWIPLYTTPPQRKPLTDEQKMALCKQFPDHLTFNAIHAIEAAHNIKE